MRSKYYSIAFSVAFAGATAFGQINPSVATGTDWKSPTSYRSTLVPRDNIPRAPRGQPANVGSRWSGVPARGTPPAADCVRHPVTVVTVVTVYAPVCDSTAAIYAYEESQNFYQRGYEWGAGLKGNAIAWADFIPYLEQFVVSASPVANDAFREGYIRGFGGSGEATYDHAMRQASQRS